MLIGFLALCLVVGLSAAGVTVRNVATWYHTLNRPPFSPPDWIFGPVWTALYIMMAVAAWLVWRRPDAALRSQTALTFWAGQLALNASWPPIFFGLHLTGLALAVVLALLAAVSVTALKFWRLNRNAGRLMLPYIAWGLYATYLNAGFWWLNR
jgi:tryptophan-rich sensory protein